jgi:KTSC domain
MGMKWVWVDSRAFSAVAYRRGKRQLYVRFHSGKIYRYLDFPPARYHELLGADSKGTYFAENIRGKFLYEEVGEARLGLHLVYSSGK